jgi:hypothetical protein
MHRYQCTWGLRAGDLISMHGKNQEILPTIPYVARGHESTRYFFVKILCAGRLRVLFFVIRVYSLP